jgi:putative ABC transport system permease protein
MERLFKDTFPYDTFYWVFLDENVQKYYAVEKVARNQIAAFTVIAVAIACMGLLGLVSNKVAEKTKEIGIRKALGASLPNIAQLLLHATTRQIMVAVLISIPVAYLLVVKYLEKFSDRITLEWWHFAVPVIALVLIMSGTIAKVVLKAAKENPVEALKHE